MDEMLFRIRIQIIYNNIFKLYYRIYFKKYLNALIFFFFVTIIQFLKIIQNIYYISTLRFDTFKHIHFWIQYSLNI